MLVPRITFECISAMYGEEFAKMWFRPISVIREAS